jgi:hypothetical protein
MRTALFCLTIGMIWFMAALRLQAQLAVNLTTGVTSPSIQVVIDDFTTTSGHTIRVYPGVYPELINFHGKNLRVVGDTLNPDQCIIAGMNMGSVVTFNTGENSTALLAGFTIQEGLAVEGGGIYIVGSTPSLRYLVIRNNKAQKGGGMYLSELEYIFLEKLQVLENSSVEGGGMYASFIHCDLETSVFKFNVAESISGWGAGGGGAMYLLTCPHFNVRNCKVIENHAYKSEHCAVNASGGGIHCVNSGLDLINVLVAGNTSDYFGGGIWTAGSDLVLLQVTVADNVSQAWSPAPVYGSTGSGMAVLEDNNIKVLNSIFYHNHITEMYFDTALYPPTPSMAYLEFSDVEGGLAKIILNSSAGHQLTWKGPGFYTSNTDKDPLFTGPTDYHLQNNSPCNDKANPATAPPDDLDGLPRPYPGPNPDMGAYENQSCQPPKIVVPPVNQVVSCNQNATFSCQATGSGVLYYRWQVKIGLWLGKWITIKNGIENYVTIPYGMLTGVFKNAGFRCIVSNSCGIGTSNIVKVTLNVSPLVFLVHPLDQQVCEGDAMQMHVTVQKNGGGTISYQWYKDGASIPGATNYYYQIPSCLPSDSGYYFCKVSDGCASASSQSAFLDVDSRPVILADPLDQYVHQGDSALFTVNAVGNQVSYIWEEDFGMGWNVVSVGYQYFLVYPVMPQMNGWKFRVIAQNWCGSDTSAVATLYVTSKSSTPLSGEVPACPDPEITLFPNPFSDHFTIKFAGLSGESLHITVTDVYGRLVSTCIVPPGVALTEISAAWWENGIYIIGMTSGEKKLFSARLIRAAGN